MNKTIKQFLLVASLTAVLPVTASAADVGYSCNVEWFLNPFVDKSNKGSVAFDKQQREYATSKELTVAIRGTDVTVVGAFYPGPLTMHIAQHGTKENGWSFLALIDGAASSPGRVCLRRPLSIANRLGPTNVHSYKRFMRFLYLLDPDRIDHHLVTLQDGLQHR